MNEMILFVIGFTVTLAIVVLADVLIARANDNAPVGPDRAVYSRGISGAGDLPAVEKRKEVRGAV